MFCTKSSAKQCLRVFNVFSDILPPNMGQCLQWHSGLKRQQENCSFADENLIFLICLFNHYNFFWGDKPISNMSHGWLEVMYYDQTVTRLHSQTILRFGTSCHLPHSVEHFKLGHLQTKDAGVLAQSKGLSLNNSQDLLACAATGKVHSSPKRQLKNCSFADAHQFPKVTSWNSYPEWDQSRNIKMLILDDLNRQVTSISRWWCH
jgi:hypothetical protein